MEAKMGKKCLITYSSFTGNTERVALRLKETFEKKGCNVIFSKVRKKLRISSDLL